MTSRIAPTEILACAVVLGAALGFGIPRHRDGINLYDEGFLACSAIRVLGGELPLRDFESLQPPLAFYSVAALFAVAGPSLVALRAFGLALRFAAQHARATPSRLLRLWLTGAAAVAVPLLALFGVLGAWPDMLRQLVVFPLTTYPKTSGIPMPWFAPDQDARVRWLIAAYYLPLVLQAGVAAALAAPAR